MPMHGDLIYTVVSEQLHNSYCLGGSESLPLNVERPFERPTATEPLARSTHHLISICRQLPTTLF